MLSANDIGRFQEIAKKTLGIKLSNDEASFQALALVNLMEILLMPTPQENPEISTTD